MTDASKKLTESLEAAANEIPGAAAEFFRLLMKSTVFLPVKSEPKSGVPILGQLETRDLGFLTVLSDGEEILPIFSEADFVGDWADRELFYAECEFRKLIWLIGESTVFHLNPGQEVGKEISRWEIEKLRNGEAAIEEIVAELEGAGDEDLLVQPAGPEFDPFRKKLLPILEIASELELAFLVLLSEEESARTSPALGVKYSADISEERRAYFRAEFENCSRQSLPPEMQLTIFDELDDETNPNWSIFEDASPFYLATVDLDKNTEKGSIVHDLWQRLGNFRSADDDSGNDEEK